MEKRTNERSWKPPRLTFLESTGIKTALLLAVLLVLGIWVATTDLTPDLSYLDNRMLSGPRQGQYYQTVEGLQQAAHTNGGVIQNVETAGTIATLQQLSAETENCDVQFGLAQDGQDWSSYSDQLRLIGRLWKQESVFFLGKNADAIESFSDLKNYRRIGIGPNASGTANLARRILESPDFLSLQLELSNHDVDEQLEMLVQGNLDLAIFVMDEDAQFITNAIRTDRLQIASFDHLDVIARRFPFVRSGRVGAGQYDPLNPLPPTDKGVLRVSTLVVSNQCAERSQVMGLMSLLERAFPGFIRHNNDSANTTGLELDAYAKTFFEAKGPSLLDNYFPSIGDIMPPSNWVHIVMAVSILFNLMGFWNRFRLWRVDANRVKAELFIPVIFGSSTTIDEIEYVTPDESQITHTQREQLDELISRIETLIRRCRRQSLSVLVPMGGEMAYRYQESIMERTLLHLRAFRSRLLAVTQKQTPSRT
jgi:TRAP-type uncharacterized transport system substrate-binding protein